MKKNLLIVSDNFELSSYILNELSKFVEDYSISVDWCCTILNKNPEAMIEAGAQQINIKDSSVVDDLIGKYDLIFSLHCKQIFPKKLVERVCCINFHPGFNPYNRGWFPQAFSIVNGLPVGATIHLMDAEVDHGRIIDQEIVEIESSDTSLEVYRKVIDMEKILIKKNLQNIISGNFEMRAPWEEGNYNGISDYISMCRLNLDSVGTLRDHINILRATSHGEFKNAYYVDGISGEKFYVKIIIESASNS